MSWEAAGASATTVERVSAAADVGPVEPGRVPFADASPAQVRAALTVEDAAEFDRQWRALMARATERLDLSEVQEALQGWRQVAWVTSAHGPETYRAPWRRPGSGCRAGSGPRGRCRGRS